ncbi:MAG: HU family DNA-binding protein [Solirubrobacteraceae bacterium]
MTKAALVERVAAETQLSRRDAACAVEAVLALIERELRGGGQVSLAGFGKFHTARRGARAGVHPRTGEPMTVGATTVPRFTAGSALKKAVREL